jgi:uncharacterized membrane protein
MNAPGHVDFYAIVLFLHIVAAIGAFGITFAYPVIDRVVRTRDARSLPTYHEAQIQVSRRVVTPSAVIVLIAGIYMASDKWGDFSSGWWSGALAILVVLLGIEHGFLIPNARRLRDRAALDVQGGSGGALSADYQQLARQRSILVGISSLLVVIAVFLMVVKPGV